MTTLVTGVAGFIGYHVAEALLANGETVVGLDDFNSYYDIRLKRERVARLEGRSGFLLHTVDVADLDVLASIGSRVPAITRIVHLAAQAGVRYSLTDPFAYLHSNIVGHLAVIEFARRLNDCRHVVYASSSSVYGGNKPPFAESDRVDRPQSIYAATKRSGELISESYAHLYGLPQTGLRFFTVYGPWGRPDMAYFHFADAIMTGRPITLFEGGELRRDFTFIADVVHAILALLDRPPEVACSHRVLNVGNGDDQPVIQLVRLLEEGLGRKAEIRWAPRPKADVAETHAVTDAIARLTEFRPETQFHDGVMAFLAWYRDWFGRNGVSSGEPFSTPGWAPLDLAGERPHHMRPAPNAPEAV